MAIYCFVEQQVNFIMPSVSAMKWAAMNSKPIKCPQRYPSVLSKCQWYWNDDAYVAAEWFKICNQHDLTDMYNVYLKLHFRLVIQEKFFVGIMFLLDSPATII